MAPSSSQGERSEPLWAVATGGYRVEGGVRDGGRGASIWDVFAHTPGRIADGSTGDVAADQHRRFDEDLALAVDLGVTAVRLSVAWTRIQPDGLGRPNREGLDLYERRIDALLGAGLEVWLCPFHHDLPEGLQALGGWGERDTVHRFNDYVATLAERWGDRLARIVLLHEANGFARLGHLDGVHAPGLRDPRLYGAALHHLVLATRLAAERLREMGGWTLAASLRLRPLLLADPDNDDDIEALERYRAHDRDAFLGPWLRRSYPPEVEHLVEAWVREDDLVREPPLDAIEAAVGPPLEIRADPDDAFGARARPARLDAERGAELLRDLLVELAAELDERALTALLGARPLAGEVLDGRGELHDPERIDALAADRQAVAAAAELGAPIDGVIVDPLLDGFEWHHGFARPRGLVHVDRATLARTPKGSFRWLAETIRGG